MATTPTLGLTKLASSDSAVDFPATENGNLDIIDAMFAYNTITDFNTFAPAGTKSKRIYGQCTGGSASNGPYLSSNGDNATFRGYAEGVPAYFTQHFTVEYATTISNRGRTFIRTCVNGTFGKWLELQNAYPVVTVPASGGTMTFTMALYGQCIVTVMGFSESSIGVFLLVRNPNALVAKSLGTAPSTIAFSMDTSSGVVTLTNNYGSGVNVRIERFNGGITV